jgi:predicted aldo/keto reductase-like oxidoreductase
MPSCPQEIYIPGLINSRVTRDLWPHRQWFARQSNIVESGKTCIEYGTCEEKCPYQLPIREMIAENIAFYERACFANAWRQSTAYYFELGEAPYSKSK